MKRISLNRNQIKYLVIIAMLIDHIAWAFVPMNTVLGQVMHFIGRLTGPTMAYFLAEGYLHTRNVKKYAARLGIFALLSWIPFVFFEYGTLPITIIEGKSIRGMFLYLSSKNITITFYPFFGVIYTLLLSLLAIWLWDKGRCPKWCKVFGIIGLCILSTLGDWPVFDVLFALYFFIYWEQPKNKWTAYSIIAGISVMVSLSFGGILNNLFQFGVAMIPILIQFCYNGESGSRKPVHKWFFYIFYPAHLMILGILR
ncbi:MAG: conjugal transfer protein TraX [Lachnospiraceae bacterium]|nr:conjugal transfer protein TraX [Lachnospiraceae bacterium]